MIGFAVVLWIILGVWIGLVVRGKWEKLYLLGSRNATYIVLAGFAVALIFFTVKFASFKPLRPEPGTASADAEVALVVEAVGSFRQDIGRFPAMKEGLNVLIKAKGIKGWNGPYLKDPMLLNDAWGNDYACGLVEIGGKPLFFVGSRGPNRKWDTPTDILEQRQVDGDDIIKWVE